MRMSDLRISFGEWLKARDIISADKPALDVQQAGDTIESKFYVRKNEWRGRLIVRLDITKDMVDGTLPLGSIIELFGRAVMETLVETQQTELAQSN